MRLSVSPSAQPLLDGVGSETNQILLVETPASGISTVIHAMERRQGNWVSALPVVTAVVGRNGLAAPGAKREGDGKTPCGTFPVLTAFGYAPRITSRMPYWHIRSDDAWVDDPNSIDYNTPRKLNQIGRGVSVEPMKRMDGLYEYGLIIGYNMKPVIKGAGSAIFFHVWKGPAVPTAGCIAMSREDMCSILAWIDPEQQPLAMIGCSQPSHNDPAC